MLWKKKTNNLNSKWKSLGSEVTQNSKYKSKESNWRLNLTDLSALKVQGLSRGWKLKLDDLSALKVQRLFHNYEEYLQTVEKDSTKKHKDTHWCVSSGVK